MYDLSVDLLKATIIIIDPLTYCINRCLISGSFPQSLKIAKTEPILKKGDPGKVSNYRPISLLPFFSKVLEKVICIQLTKFFESNNILVNSQFGFRKNLSSVDAV